MGRVAPDGCRLSARRPPHLALRAPPSERFSAAWRQSCATTSAACRPRPRCGSGRMTSRTRGTSKRSTARCTTSSAAYPFDADARGLPRPHHDRHARRADLPVPPDRVAAHPRPPAPDQSAGAEAARHGGRAPIASSTSTSRKYDRIASRFAREALDDTSLPEVGHRHAQRATSTRSSIGSSTSPSRSAAPILLLGPTGAGKSLLARRIYELKRHAASDRGAVRRGELRHAPRRRRDVGALRPREGRVHRRDARPARACCSARTGASSSSTRWRSSASTSRPCCCARSRRSGSCRWAATARSRASSSSSPARTAISRRPSGPGGSARTCSRGSTSGRSRCRASRTVAKTSLPISTTSWTSSGAARATSSPSAARPGTRSWPSRRATKRDVAGELPRPQRGGHTPGDARARRTDHRRAGRGRDRPPPRGVDARRTCRGDGG